MQNIPNVILVGDANVGKTSIFQRLALGKFEDHLDSTIGASFAKYVNNDLNINVNLWDTAGQERFNSMVPLYIRRGDLIMLIFDITKNVTSQIEKYLNFLEKIVLPESLIDILIIFNKSDMVESDVIDETKILCMKILKNYHDKHILSSPTILNNIITGIVFDNGKNIIVVSAKTGYGFDDINSAFSNFKNDTNKQKGTRVFSNVLDDSSDNKCAC